MAVIIPKSVDWVLTIRHENDPAIRALLIGTLFEDRSIAVAALFWTQLCWSTILTATGWLWALGLMAVDGLLFVLRWRLRERRSRIEERPTRSEEQITVCASLVAVGLIAVEVVLLFGVASLRTTVLAILLDIGFIGYVTVMFSGFPRLAALAIAALSTALTTGLAASHLSELRILALLIPCGGLAYLILMRRLHTSLLDAVRAQHHSHLESLHDPLTGLPNRALLLQRLTRSCMQSGTQGPSAFASVLCLDLDGFKGVNDRYGHAAGDQVLVEVARRLRASVRETDTVSRFGGDEFVVLLPTVTDLVLRAIGERIIAAVAEPVDIGLPNPVHVGVSIGVASFGREGGTPMELLGRADAALYGAKRGGRGRLQFAS